MRGVVDRMMVVASNRQQHAAFQILDRRLEVDLAARSPPAGAIGDILAKHGPSWTERHLQFVIVSQSIIHDPGSRAPQRESK
jgi:hypothetical protein